LQSLYPQGNAIGTQVSTDISVDDASTLEQIGIGIRLDSRRTAKQTLLPTGLQPMGYPFTKGMTGRRRF